MFMLLCTIPIVKVGKTLKNEEMKIVRNICCDQQWEARDPDHVGLLTKETIDSGHSVLIFCCSKKSCEETAKKLKSILTVPERSIGRNGGIMPNSSITSSHQLDLQNPCSQ